MSLFSNQARFAKHFPQKSVELLSILYKSRFHRKSYVEIFRRYRSNRVCVRYEYLCPVESSLYDRAVVFAGPERDRVCVGRRYLVSTGRRRDRATAGVASGDRVKATVFA